MAEPVVAVPKAVAWACKALRVSAGVDVRPELLVCCAAPTSALSSTHEEDANSRAKSVVAPAPAPMELWKALHDLVIGIICLHQQCRPNATAAAAAWRTVSQGGPRAVRFDAIRAMIQVKMRDFGYSRELSAECAAPDLLCAFCWLVAQSGVLRRYASACCAQALLGTPLLPVRGSSLWAADAASSVMEGEGEGDYLEKGKMGTGYASDGGLFKNKSTAKESAPPSADAVTYRVSAECGQLWHAARQLAAAEERRTLLLRQLCKLQVPLRPGAQRLLTPTELEAQLRSEDPAMRVILDERIAKVKSARNACADACAFWEWCAVNVPPPPPPTTMSTQAAISVKTTQEDLAELNVDELIRDTFGLEVRKSKAV